ncbi:hypothetical protein SLS62_004044 [Diatrype stigma]|uniref:NACHT domain-containing protein n=1 Tax=Diatrype stigma TaxID=117547 RepID=A0AAN9UUY9_9PEZI
MVALFARTLSFLAQCVICLESSIPKQMIRAAFDTRKLADQLSAIDDLERRVDLAAGVCDWQLNDESRQESRSRYHDLCWFLDNKLLWQGGLLQAMWVQSARERDVKVLQWISDVSYESDLNNVREGRVPGTCQWLLEHPTYEEWLDQADSGILWLHGIPGAGKTNLSSKVVDSLQHYFRWRDDVGLAYFFCDRNRPSHQDPQSIMCSLVRQLSVARNHEKIMTCTAEMYAKKELAEFASDRLFWDEALSLLLQLVSAYRQTYIVLDGLDECDKDGRMRLLDAIDELVRRNPHSLKLFIASREDDDIKDRYSSSSNLRIAAHNNQEDIERFVVSKIEAHKRFSGSLSSGVRGEILSTFARKSQGMFMWAKLMIDGLLKLKLERDILQYLKDIPRDLSAAYNTVYRIIQEREGSAGEVADRAFQLIMCSGRSSVPSTPETIARMISLDMDMYDPDAYESEVTVDYILDVCHNLVEIAETPSPVFRLAHLSVQEYFETNHWTQAQAHLFTARLCLKSLFSQKKLHPGMILYASRWYEDWGYSGYDVKDEGLRKYFPRVFADPFVPGRLYPLLATWLGSGDFASTAKLYCINPQQAPIFTCCFFGIADVVQVWFRSGRLRDTDKRWIANNLLTLVADRNHVDICKLFLESGADPNKGYGSIYTRPPLHLAARPGASHLEVVRLLLQHGALPNLETAYFGTALDDALEGEEPLQVVQILERYGATLGEDRRRRRALLEMVRSGQTHRL